MGHATIIAENFDERDAMGRYTPGFVCDSRIITFREQQFSEPNAETRMQGVLYAPLCVAFTICVYGCAQS